MCASVQALSTNCYNEMHDGTNNAPQRPKKHLHYETAYYIAPKREDRKSHDDPDALH